MGYLMVVSVSVFTVALLLPWVMIIFLPVFLGVLAVGGIAFAFYYAFFSLDEVPKIICDNNLVLFPEESQAVDSEKFEETSRKLG